MTLDVPPVEALLPRLAAAGITLPPGPVRVGGYGDSEALSAELLALIRAGRKRGGASLLWAHELEGEPLPGVGEIEIVVDHRGEPALVTRNTRVEVVPFREVDAAFAAREGEGDGTLDAWREGHWAYFTRECERIGRTPSESMPVVCTSFELVAVVPEAR